MSISGRNAFWEWVAGLIVGFIPLACHGVLHFVARPSVDHAETWSTDILFVSIANSGLLFVSMLIRLVTERKKLGVYCIPLGGLNLLISLTAGVTYGSVAIGQAKGFAVTVSILLLVASVIVSAIFELSFALEND